MWAIGPLLILRINMEVLKRSEVAINKVVQSVVIINHLIDNVIFKFCFWRVLLSSRVVSNPLKCKLREDPFHPEGNQLFSNFQSIAVYESKETRIDQLYCEMIIKKWSWHFPTLSIHDNVLFNRDQYLFGRWKDHSN